VEAQQKDIQYLLYSRRPEKKKTKKKKKIEVVAAFQ